jgi:hypothetical protein
VTPLAAIAATLTLAGMPAPTMHYSPTISRAAGIPVLCSDSYRSWMRFVEHWPEDQDAASLYMPRVHAIAMQSMICRELTHPRRVSRTSLGRVGLSSDILVLGHEVTHYEQDMAGEPFDEDEADCGGLAKFHRIASALGIKRHLPKPWIEHPQAC